MSRRSKLMVHLAQDLHGRENPVVKKKSPQKRRKLLNEVAESPAPFVSESGELKASFRIEFARSVRKGDLFRSIYSIFQKIYFNYHICHVYFVNFH